MAETGDCILCNNLNKSCNQCHCPHWKGVCIYQEFTWNGYKAKEGRKYFKGTLVDKINHNENLFVLVIKTDDYLVRNLTSIGSYVFLRRPEDKPMFGSPISIMDVNTKENQIIVAIEKKGVKTEKLFMLEKDDEILVKGPFWNGVLGLRHYDNLKNETCILICRGIGAAPLIPILKRLHNQNNDVIAVIDNGHYDHCFIKEYLNRYAKEAYFINTFDKGNLPKEFQQFLINTILERKPALVHCSCLDVVNYKTMRVVDKINAEKTMPEIKFTCCNNAKMCCGEGVCGCCTLRNNDDLVRRMCKMQTDPKYIFEGRRLY